MTQNFKEKIERYINGNANNKEKEDVESMFLYGEENCTLRYMVNRDWNKIINEPETDIDLSHQLDRIHHIIRRNELRNRKKPVQNFLRIYMKIAAILLLPFILSVAIGYKLFNKESNLKTEHSVYTAPDNTVFATIFAPMGARVSFNLPDGSKGMLNSGSTISYSVPFNNNRAVKLEGEVWLEVKKDENNPFEISTGNTSVKVLGTSFNLSAYPAENYVELVLTQGKVDFKAEINKNHIIINPSERLVFQDGLISKTTTDPAKYNAWTEGKLVFRGDPMSEVARRIERWYNVKIVLADKELEKYSFRATFQDDKLEEVLHFLSMTSPIRYKVTPRKVLPDGTYEKEKVAIFLKK